MRIHFSELRSPQVQEAADAKAALVLPVGQIEEHGRHLPLKTDLLIIRRVSEEAVRRLEGRPPCHVLDPISYGYSGQVMKNWPGTFIIPQQTLTEMIKHVLTSVADMGFRKLIVLSGHGNHVGVLRTVAREVADATGIGPGVAFPYAFAGDVLEEHAQAGPGGSCHGGEFETSLMLHLAPELVDMHEATFEDRLRDEFPYSSREAFVSTWTRQKSKHGIYGDPTVAAADLGELAFEKMVEETTGFIRHYYELEQV
jgi:creatinine amidohydrolase